MKTWCYAEPRRWKLAFPQRRSGGHRQELPFGTTLDQREIVCPNGLTSLAVPAGVSPKGRLRGDIPGHGKGSVGHSPERPRAVLAYPRPFVSGDRLVYECLDEWRIGEAIHRMVTPLSTSAMARLRSAVRTLRYTFAYDNFDINFKVSQATVEKSSLFVSATSAIALPLYDGGPLNLNLEAMRCSAELWDRSDTNPFPVLPLPESHELQDTLCELRNESDNFSEDEVSLTPHEKRMAWQKPDGVCFNDPPL